MASTRVEQSQRFQIRRGESFGERGEALTWSVQLIEMRD